MVLQALKSMSEVYGVKVAHSAKDDAEGKYICIDHDENVIGFRMQNGPVKEVGVNGCHVDTIVATSIKIIHHLNKALPCRQNEQAMLALENALMALESRKKDRVSRGVEGTSKE